MPGTSRPTLLTRPTGVIAPVGIDRSRRLAWEAVQHTDRNQRLGPATDPTHSHWLHKFDLSESFRFFYGRIVDGIAYANCYKVQPERGAGTLWCSMFTHTALQPMGAKQFGQLPPGCPVLFAQHPTSNTGVILGVFPPAQTSSASAFADFISQAGRSGLLVDTAHRYPLDQARASLATDWSAGRPLDATAAGEVGHISETGLLHFLDSFMSAQRVNEECGVWHFYTDSLTRVAGHNLQLWTAGHEREDINDEGEFDSVHGYTPYPWEALGVLVPGGEACREIDTVCWQRDPDSQGYSGREPLNDQQVAYYRLRDFYGYWGQAHKRVLSLPPPPCTADTRDFEGDQSVVAACGTQDQGAQSLHLLPDRLILPGVFEENLALTGRYSLRSAHEIIFSKTLRIPVPKQVALPQDARADKSSNYKAAGYQGSGDDHVVTGDINADVGPDDPAQIRAACFLDEHSFAFNWIGNHPFHYHNRDWYLPEESELNYLREGCQAGCQAAQQGVQGAQGCASAPAFQELACHHFLQAPQAIPINVDHRYGDVNYYPNHSYFAMLPEGGIVLGDGFGAEIKLSNGHIYLTTPGDINLQSGRNVVSFAGHDFVARAKNSWDITATEKDGRLKARNNLWMLASGDTGGILLQSNATTVARNEEAGESAVMAGIAIKAENGLISLCGQDMNLSLTESDDEHSILFDAGWTGRLRFRAQFFERFLATDGAALDFWTDPTSDTVQSGSEWWQDGAVICTPVVLRENVLMGACLTVRGDIASTMGHISTGSADVLDGLVTQLPANDMEDTFAYYMGRCGQLAATGAEELTTLLARVEDYNLCDVNFSFRVTEDYRTEDFVLFESRWQQLARLQGNDVGIWQEEEEDDTYPYPGKEALEGTTLRTIDPVLYDVSTESAVDRGAEYEEPEFAAPNSVTLNGNYLVII